MIIWKLTNAHSCWHYLGGRGGVCFKTRMNNYCSVDSDDDFRWGYRDVSHYYCLLAVTTSQEYSYLEDQTKQSKGTFVLQLHTF